MKKNVSRWKKAVVHLECAANSVSPYKRMDLLKKYKVLLESGEINQDEYLYYVKQGNRDVRTQGTAIFLEDNSIRYLLTAKHVVNDKMGLAHKKASIDVDYLNYEHEIFSMIYKIPSVDNLLEDNNYKADFIMNLNVGSSLANSYTFSDDERDLALISLTGIHSKFAEGLIEEGYVPIKLKDISTNNLSEGDEIFSIGYPAATAIIGERPLPEEDKEWGSHLLSLPVASFGKVAMYHKSLEYYWGDISIYPGNSGGPIIRNNKLVGIVSAQSTIPSEDILNAENGEIEKLITRVRIPFAKIIRSEFIFELIELQRQKDSLYM